MEEASSSSPQLLQAEVTALRTREDRIRRVVATTTSSSSWRRRGRRPAADVDDDAASWWREGDDDDAAVSYSSLRPLLPSEIQTLRANGCRRCRNGSTAVDDDDEWNSDDDLRLLLLWKRTPPPSAAVADDVDDVSAILRRRVSHTVFGPHVVLVVSMEETEEERDDDDDDESGSSSLRLPSTVRSLPAGCHRNGYVSHCVLDLHATCHSNGTLRHAAVQAHAAVVGCGAVTVTTRVPSWRVRLRVGPESGGSRPLSLPVEATMKTVTDQLVRCTDAEDHVDDDDDTTLPPSSVNIFVSGSYARHTATIDGVVLHAGASVDAAAIVTRTRLLPEANVTHGCSLADCLLQWKASVTDHATLRSVVVMERAEVGSHGLCSHAVLGPDAHVGAGEVHATVLGPQTNAHHQSLCIGVLWPHGRGNVGYGANVGSNHTGRSPDQEVAAAEGCFWGLSSVVVMPCNLSHSPYCIVAAGTTVPPGVRLALPFALLTRDGRVLPGWVYGRSPYTVVRSAHKHVTRRNARRHAYYTGWNVLRPSVVRLCVRAREGLLRRRRPDDEDDDVCGPFHCDDRARRSGVDAYTTLIQRYALHELLRLCRDGSSTTMVQRVSRALRDAPPLPPDIPPLEWAPFPWDEDASQETAYQRSLLVREFPLHDEDDDDGGTGVSRRWIRRRLLSLADLETRFAAAVRGSKARDDVRGSRTIPHYAATHVAADDDPVITRQHEECRTVQGQIQDVLTQLPTSRL